MGARCSDGRGRNMRAGYREPSAVSSRAVLGAGPPNENRRVASRAGAARGRVVMRLLMLCMVLSLGCSNSRSGKAKDVVGGGDSGSFGDVAGADAVVPRLGPPSPALGCLRDQVCAGVQGGREDCEPGERCSTTLAVPKCQKLYCEGPGESRDPSVGGHPLREGPRVRDGGFGSAVPGSRVRGEGVWSRRVRGELRGVPPGLDV